MRRRAGKRLGELVACHFTRIWIPDDQRVLIGGDVIAVERGFTLSDALSRSAVRVRDYGNVAATSFGGRQDFRSSLKNNESPL